MRSGKLEMPIKARFMHCITGRMFHSGGSASTQAKESQNNLEGSAAVKCNYRAPSLSVLLGEKDKELFLKITNLVRCHSHNKAFSYINSQGRPWEPKDSVFCFLIQEPFFHLDTISFSNEHTKNNGFSLFKRSLKGGACPVAKAQHQNLISLTDLVKFSPDLAASSILARGSYRYCHLGIAGDRIPNGKHLEAESTGFACSSQCQGKASSNCKLIKLITTVFSFHLHHLEHPRTGMFEGSRSSHQWLIGKLCNTILSKEEKSSYSCSPQDFHRNTDRILCVTKPCNRHNLWGKEKRKWSPNICNYCLSFCLLKKLIFTRLQHHLLMI